MNYCMGTGHNWSRPAIEEIGRQLIIQMKKNGEIDDGNDPSNPNKISSFNFPIVIRKLPAFYFPINNNGAWSVGYPSDMDMSLITFDFSYTDNNKTANKTGYSTTAQGLLIDAFYDNATAATAQDLSDDILDNLDYNKNTMYRNSSENIEGTPTFKENTAGGTQELIISDSAFEIYRIYDIAAFYSDFKKYAAAMADSFALNGSRSNKFDPDDCDTTYATQGNIRTYCFLNNEITINYYDGTKYGSAMFFVISPDIDDNSKYSLMVTKITARDVRCYRCNPSVEYSFGNYSNTNTSNDYFYNLLFTTSFNARNLIKNYDFSTGTQVFAEYTQDARSFRVMTTFAITDAQIKNIYKDMEKIRIINVNETAGSISDTTFIKGVDY